jgi:hypothetical protein
MLRRLLYLLTFGWVRSSASGACCRSDGYLECYQEYDCDEVDIRRPL